MFRTVMVSDAPPRARSLRTARWVAASLALHVPLAPFTSWWAWFEQQSAPAGGVAANVAAPTIPVELDAEALASDPGEAQPASDDASSSEAVLPPRRSHRKRRAALAKLALPAPQRTVRTEQAGGLGAAASGEANAGVRLIVHVARAREHNAASLSPLLAAALGASGCRDFFDHAQLNALRDLDRVLVAGASLGGGPGTLAIFESNLKGDALKTALEQVVRDSSPAGTGAWLTSAVPLAQAQLAGDARVFGLPNPTSLVSAALGDRAAVEGFAKDSRIAGPTRDELASLYFASPARSLAGIVDVPSRLHQARVFVKASENDGVMLELTLQDDSAEHALEDARQLQQALVSGRQLGGRGALGNVRPFSGAHVHAAQLQVFGEVELDAQQVAAVTALLNARP